jgi:hypothetical protein
VRVCGWIATEIGVGVGREPTLFYENSRDASREFQPGPEEVLTNLEIVNEKELFLGTGTRVPSRPRGAPEVSPYRALA